MVREKSLWSLFLDEKLSKDVILPGSLNKPLVEPDKTIIAEIEAVLGILPLVACREEVWDRAVKWNEDLQKRGYPGENAEEFKRSFDHDWMQGLFNLKFGVRTEEGHVVGLGLDGGVLSDTYDSLGEDYIAGSFAPQIHVVGELSLPEYEIEFKKVIAPGIAGMDWERIHYRGSKLWQYFENNPHFSEEPQSHFSEAPLPDFSDHDWQVYNQIRQKQAASRISLSDDEQKICERILQKQAEWTKRIEKGQKNAKGSFYRELTYPEQKVWDKRNEMLLKIESEKLEITKNLSYLSHFPEVLEKISRFPHLKSLNLMNNHLSTLPDSFGRLSTMDFLNLSGNAFTTLPEWILDLPNLRVLNLNNNQISSVPESIDRLSKLTYLNFSRNQISSLPRSILKLPQLNQLEASENPKEFTEFVDEWRSLRMAALGQNKTRFGDKSM